MCTLSSFASMRSNYFCTVKCCELLLCAQACFKWWNVIVKSLSLSLSHQAKLHISGVIYSLGQEFWDCPVPNLNYTPMKDCWNHCSSDTPTHALTHRCAESDMAMDGVFRFSTSLDPHPLCYRHDLMWLVEGRGFAVTYSDFCGAIKIKQLSFFIFRPQLCLILN